jgi:hypothetical protein
MHPLKLIQAVAPNCGMERRRKNTKNYRSMDLKVAKIENINVVLLFHFKF